MWFKTCTMCEQTWMNRDRFLEDPEVEFIGYQANLAELEAGFFLFQHNRPGCETAMAVTVSDLSDLQQGPVFSERKSGSSTCRGYCKRRSDLSLCPVECECAYVQDIIQIIRQWQKRAA